jgi:hypothetical protein
MEQSHLSLRIRARYGDLVRISDRLPHEDGAGYFESPVPHTPILLPRRSALKPQKKASAGN